MTVSQPALAHISFYLAKPSSVKNQNGPARHLSLANEPLSWVPFLSDWLKIKNSPQLAGEWIRQVFISLPFPFHRNICVHNFRIVIWALREGHRGLWDLSVWWRKVGCSVHQGGGGQEACCTQKTGWPLTKSFLSQPLISQVVRFWKLASAELSQKASVTKN